MKIQNLERRNLNIHCSSRNESLEPQKLDDIHKTDRGSEARGHQWVSVEDSFHSSAEHPEMSKGQGDRDGQEDELVLRLLAPLCFSDGRRFRKLMRFHKQSLESAGEAHSDKDVFVVGNGDQVILLGVSG